MKKTKREMIGMSAATNVLKVAAGQIGTVERPANSNNTKYGKAFGMNGVPWCAIFLWWCFQNAKAGKLFPHNANAAYAQDEVVSKCGGKWIMKKNTSKGMRRQYLKDAKPGDIVTFDFGRFDAYRRHIGIVEKVSGDYLICSEGNTSKAGSQSNGGMVCRQRRIYTAVCAAARPAYSGTKTTASISGILRPGDKGEDVKELQTMLNAKLAGAFATIYINKLVVDGDFGKETTKAVKLFQNANHLEVDGEAGPKTIGKLRTLKVTTAVKAINWAVATASDNRFAYGTGKRAHHNGCYYCGTNITGPKKAKKGSKWEYTYCCNPFIHAAYSHGGGVASMLAACKRNNAAGMEAKDWTKHGFKLLGKVSKVPFGSLKAGDVIIINHSEHHVWMFTGANGIVEASGGTFDPSSIAHKGGARTRYSSYAKDSTAYVLRYAG